MAIPSNGMAVNLFIMTVGSLFVGYRSSGLGQDDR
jgi:hypothetical protein